MRLLAIDPDALFSPGILRALSQEGFIVDKTKEVNKGIWMGRANLYDVILLLIPEQESIIDAFQRINQDQPSAFVIALIGPKNVDARVVLLEAGLDDALYYPCSFREFVVRIRSMLRRIKNTAEAPFFDKIDDLTINPLSFSVRRGKIDIILRRKEFDLLHYLFRNLDKVVTKSNILEGVWDANADLFTNTLEVHVLNLRRKIDSGYPPERRLIHTVYGRGYLFGLRPGVSAVTPATAPVSSN
ncbi:MAG: response regulator transcription factor [Candidatus Moraniibacteriota bacterium]